MSERRLRSAVLLDDHPLWLEAIEPIVSRVGAEVIAKTTDPEVALALVETHEPDLFVTEVALASGEVDGVRCIERALEQAPELTVVVVSAETADTRVRKALMAGATAYVFKTVEADDLASAIGEAFDHSAHVSNGSIFGSRRSVKRPAELEALTRREREILRLVAEGRSNAKIARQLAITVPTVKVHLTNAYRKIGVSNRTEAARWAQVSGLVRPWRSERGVDRGVPSQ